MLARHAPVELPPVAVHAGDPARPRPHERAGPETRRVVRPAGDRATLRHLRVDPRPRGAVGLGITRRHGEPLVRDAGCTDGHPTTAVSEPAPVDRRRVTASVSPPSSGIPSRRSEPSVGEALEVERLAGGRSVEREARIGGAGRPRVEPQDAAPHRRCWPGVDREAVRRRRHLRRQATGGNGARQPRGRARAAGHRASRRMSASTPGNSVDQRLDCSQLEIGEIEPRCNGAAAEHGSVHRLRRLPHAGRHHRLRCSRSARPRQAPAGRDEGRRRRSDARPRPTHPVPGAPAHRWASR